jgi:hypothetical protein
VCIIYSLILPGLISTPWFYFVVFTAEIGENPQEKWIVIETMYLWVFDVFSVKIFEHVSFGSLKATYIINKSSVRNYKQQLANAIIIVSERGVHASRASVEYYNRISEWNTVKNQIATWYIQMLFFNWFDNLILW